MKTKPSIVLTRVFYKREVASDEESAEIAKLTNKSPEIRKKFFRSKKRIYIADIESIEEYKLNDFGNFTDSPLTYIEYLGDYFIAEIDFEILKNILDKYDKDRTPIINN